ncbi:MAG: methylenetetrahydrofolate reductase [Proteobacteria bacterium]|nr:methylenetetrahydrofolate reductase [Pseudomonadota bacterium]
MTHPTFSFEMFPPKTEEGVAPLFNAVHELAKLNPAFITVTFGAGGTGATGTGHLALRIQKETGISTAAHLTYINLSKHELAEFTAGLWHNGIRRIVALRGDFPPGWRAPDYTEGRHYRFTDEFVAGLRAQHDFDISVGAYPEKHPDAPSLETDIEALKKKCTAGAKRAITQFFFENDSYFRFLDLAAKAGITTPILPGLLPIANFQRMQVFADKCGAKVPGWLVARFEKLKEEDTPKLALELLVAQIRGLKAKSVPHFHFYTLNRAGLCRDACRAAGLVV